MKIHYGGPSPLYEDVLKFTVRSGRVIEYDGVEYAIEHTQFASFNITEVFTAIVEGTTTHPLKDDDSTFEENAVESVVDNTQACIDDHRVEDFYDHREYFTPNDFRDAKTTYLMFDSGVADESMDGVDRDEGFVESKDRIECIADILTVMLAEEAGRFAHQKFGLYSGTRGIDTGEGEDYHPDEDVSHTEVCFALRDAVESHNARSVLSQPNPTKQLVAELYDIYQDAGMVPNVREVYGVMVDTRQKRSFEKNDAGGREVRSAAMQLGNKAMGMGESEKRWESVDEPPLETLKE